MPFTPNDFLMYSKSPVQAAWFLRGPQVWLCPGGAGRPDRRGGGDSPPQVHTIVGSNSTQGWWWRLSHSGKQQYQGQTVHGGRGGGGGGDSPPQVHLPGSNSTHLQRRIVSLLFNNNLNSWKT